MLVALKRKVHFLEETLNDHGSMKSLYEKQIASLRSQSDEMQAQKLERAAELDLPRLKEAVLELAASSDFEVWPMPAVRAPHTCIHGTSERCDATHRSSLILRRPQRLFPDISELLKLTPVEKKSIQSKRLVRCKE
jgi:hypothetical protein